MPSVFRNFKLQKLNFSEYFTLILISLFSLLLLISSCDMISAYLVLEIQALTFYILACFKRDSAFSTESSLKYFISGSFISSIFLFGCSIIYGLLGTLNFHDLTLLLSFSFENNSIFFYNFLLLGVILVTITFLFKLSIVPFHFWSPDVYEGAPLSSTIIFSILPKFALLHFFIKWVSIVSLIFKEISILLFICGLLTITVGSFFALRQRRIKRLIIYSSLSQMGFLITSLSIMSLNNLIAIFFFLIVYILTAILIWTHVSLFYEFQNKVNLFYHTKNKPLYISSLSNLYKRNSLWAVSIAIIFFSVAGIPPLCGFFSKFVIIFGLVSSKEIFGSFLLIIISAMSSFYYLRLIKIVFFESKKNNIKNENSQVIFESLFFIDYFLISILLFLLIFFFFNPSFLLLLCQYIILGSTFF
jgi:proton-translocating NADH-quinone oxidoreductase chain N